MSQKKSILKHTLSMGVATYISQALGVVTSISMRAFLGPTMMGVWTLLQVILGYCGYASFGTTRAMARDYPIFRGSGEDEKAEHLKDLTINFTMAMSFLPAVIILVYTFWKWSSLEFSFKIGLLFLTVFLFLQRFYDMIVTLLRSDKRFDVLSEVKVLDALGMLAVVYVFVRPFGIYGLFIGSAASVVLYLAYILWRQPYRFRIYWNNAELVQQLKLAIPLVTIGFLAAFYRSIDKLLIAKFLGFAEVGLYSIAMMITSFVYAFPMMFLHVLYPHALEEYGRTRSAEAIGKHLTQPALILAVVVPFLCGAAILLTPLVVKTFLPKFEAGIPAMKIYMVSVFFMALAQFGSNVLTVLDEYWVNLPILMISSALNAALNLLFISIGWGLNGVALGTTISFFYCGAATFIATVKNMEPLKQALARTGRISGLNLFIFAGIFLIDLLPVRGSLLAVCLLKVALLILFALPFLFFLEQKTRLVSTGYHLFRDKFKSSGYVEAADDK